jgi:hypothetical protein
MKVDHYVGLLDDLVEVMMHQLIVYPAAGFAGKEAQQIPAVDAGTAILQFEAEPIEHGHGDKVAAHLSGVQFFDYVEYANRADDFVAVNGRLDEKGEAGPGSGKEVNRDIGAKSGARLGNFEEAKHVLARLRYDVSNLHSSPSDSAIPVARLA